MGWSEEKAIFVNLYFDLYEITRRSIESHLQTLAAYDEKSILDIYQEETLRLKDQLKQFAHQTSLGKSSMELAEWKEKIENTLYADSTDIILEE